MNLSPRELSNNMKRSWVQRNILSTFTLFSLLIIGTAACSKKNGATPVTSPKLPNEVPLVDDSITSKPPKEIEVNNSVKDDLTKDTLDESDLSLGQNDNPIVTQGSGNGSEGSCDGELCGGGGGGGGGETVEVKEPVEDVTTPKELENKLTFEDYCRWVKTDAGQKEAIETLRALGLADEQIEGWLIDVRNTVSAVIVALGKKNPSEPGYLDPATRAGATDQKLCTLSMSALNEAITLVLDAGDGQIVNPDPISGKDMRLENLFLDGHKISRVGFLRNITTLSALHLNQNYIADFGIGVFVNIQKDASGLVVEDRGLYNLSTLGMASQMKKPDVGTTSIPGLEELIEAYADARLEGISELNREQSVDHLLHAAGRALVRVNNGGNLLAPRHFRGLRQDFKLSNASLLMFSKGTASCDMGSDDGTRYPKSIEEERTSRC